MRLRQRKTTIAAVTTAGLALLLVSCGPGGMHDRANVPDTFESNGERIFFTASSNSGEPIRARGGPGSAAEVHELACADCHGDDGTGGRVTLMMETFNAPNITWPELSGADHEGDHQDEEGEHPPYTAESLKKAITAGVNPAGERLDRRMPRWEMSPQDLDDLVAYIMRLGVKYEE